MRCACFFYGRTACFGITGSVASISCSFILNVIFYYYYFNISHFCTFKALFSCDDSWWVWKQLCWKNVPSWSPYLSHPVNTPRLFSMCKLGPLDVTISLLKHSINRHSKSLIPIQNLCEHLVTSCTNKFRALEDLLSVLMLILEDCFFLSRSPDILYHICLHFHGVSNGVALGKSQPFHATRIIWYLKCIYFIPQILSWLLQQFLRCHACE